MKCTAVITVAITMALGGCATSRPEMSYEQYKNITGRTYAVMKCSESGRMSPEIASAGIWSLKREMQDYVVDQDRFERHFQRWHTASDPSDAVCNSLSVRYAEVKRNLERPSTLPSVPVPTTTSCRTVFGTTTCTSY